MPQQRTQFESYIKGDLGTIMVDWHGLGNNGHEDDFPNTVTREIARLREIGIYKLLIVVNCIPGLAGNCLREITKLSRSIYLTEHAIVLNPQLLEIAEETGFAEIIGPDHHYYTNETDALVSLGLGKAHSLAHINFLADGV